MANKRRICYSRRVRCLASIVGADHLTHTAEVEADSLFSAAEQAIRQWCVFWWFSGDSPIDVKAGDKQWKVSQARVREWREARPIPPLPVQPPKANA